MNARELALKALYEVEVNKSYSDMALIKLMSIHQLPLVEKALASELTYGVITYKLRLDTIIEKYSTIKLKKLSVWILNILRLGIYQLIFLDKIPSSAAVNESVKLAKRYGHGGSSAFVNGILRTVSREGDIKYSSLSAFYSHPEWLCKMLEEQYPENYKEILKANNTHPGTTVRVNTQKTTVEEMAQALCGEIVYKNMLKIKGAIAESKEFAEGLISPQDVASYRAAEAVDAKAGELIIDVCAAPGGKSCAMAEMSENKASIISFDVYEKKIEKIKETAKRLGLTCIEAHLHDACSAKEEYIGKADKVLADVPCSGLGIIRKKPDIKWTKKEEDIDNLIPIQKKILEESSKYVKPGGILVYSTCTVNRKENEGVTEEFLKNNPFSKVSESLLLPEKNGSDGFYICKMKRE